MTTLTKEQAAAKAGAELLDRIAKREPELVAPGWFDEIHLDSLDVAHAGVCVLGQLLPEHSFHGACYALGLAGSAEFASHGFRMDLSADVDDVPDEVYPALTRAWKDEILSRRTAAVAVNPKGDTAT